MRRSGRLLELGSRLDHAEDVALLHDEQVLAVDLDLGARPFAEQDAVTGLHRRRDERTAVIPRARADGDDFALLRLFLGGGGAAGGRAGGRGAGGRAGPPGAGAGGRAPGRGAGGGRRGGRGGGGARQGAGRGGGARGGT